MIGYTDLEPGFYARFTKQVPTADKKSVVKRTYVYVHQQNETKYLARILYGNLDLTGNGKVQGPVTFSKEWLGDRLDDEKFQAEISLKPIDGHKIKLEVAA